MDPITHAVLGASVGYTCFHRQLGRQAAVIGAVAAMCPDLDIVYGATEGSFGRLVSHRGVTHSLFFGPVVGSIVGWLWWRRSSRRKESAASASPRPMVWIGLFSFALLSHPLLDLFTSYGTQLLAPFSRTRFALNAIPIVDPAYSLTLVIGLAVGLWLRGRPRAGWCTGAAVILTTGYLFLGLHLNGLAELEAREQLRNVGVENAEVHAFPTMLQIPHRRLVSMETHQVRVGFISMWRPCPIQWGRAPRLVNGYTEDLRSTYEGRIYQWFSGGLLATRLVREGLQQVVELVDLRYGFDIDPLAGMWGIRGRFTADGRLAAPPERFVKRPEVNNQSVGKLLADAFPATCDAP